MVPFQLLSNPWRNWTELVFPAPFRPWERPEEQAMKVLTASGYLMSLPPHRLENFFLAGVTLVQQVSEDSGPKLV